MTQRRRSSARRLSYGGEARAVAPRAPDERTLHINDLPDALLIEIFRQLAQLPPVTTDEEQALYARGVLPFRTFEYPGEVHPGLRAYPFLAQVCRHWKGVLESREALPALWQDLVVDFAHELITGVHVPVRWSDVRPSDEEFREVRWCCLPLTNWTLTACLHQFIAPPLHESVALIASYLRGARFKLLLPLIAGLCRGAAAVAPRG
jgi:hypothetical protein